MDLPKVFDSGAPVLMLGGTGFIGRHLCCHLHALGREATVVSRAPDLTFLLDYAPSISALTLDDFEGKREDHLRTVGTLIYLASTSVPATHRHQPWKELSENVEPAFRLFSEALDVNPEIRLVYLSSGGTVYGAGHKRPVDEMIKPEPISPYGYGKVATEECIRYLARTRGLNFAILRVANPVGIWQSNPRQGIVSVALQAALDKKPITLFNGGTQVRDFIDADDLAAAIVAAADARYYRNKTWNVGSGIGHRVREVVELVEAVSRQKIEILNVEGRSVDADYSVLDCSAISQDLGWQADTSLDESIGRIWNFKTGKR